MSMCPDGLLSENIDGFTKFIGMAMDQAMYDGCSYRGLFWCEYRATRAAVRQELVDSGLHGKELATLLQIESVKRMYTLGWRGYWRDDGCIAFDIV